jgi:hypothetical protein
MNMNRALAITLLGASAAVALQDGLAAQGQDQLKAQRAAKLKKPFLVSGIWNLDYDEARAEAKKQHKWMLTYFTRSYSP